jgi:hypothetical protein
LALIVRAAASDAAYRIAFALDTELTPKGWLQSLKRKHEPELRRFTARAFR